MISITSLEVYTSKKKLTPEICAKTIKIYKEQGKTVGLCHGGFDLTHPGHFKHFETAKEQVDILIVSITTDKFVTSRKGTGRPIYTDKLRAYMITQHQAVDHVIISPYKKGIEIIELLEPTHYIKGPDFVHKTTPGITAEREAIKKVGGDMIYTTEPPMSTTKIIQYIKNEVDNKKILLLIDRDGTLIENKEFLGKNEKWKKETIFKENVISAIIHTQTKYDTTKIVVSNQGGVARGLFNEERVKEINHYIDQKLKEKGVQINNWQYCPEADKAYVDQKKDIKFVQKYVKEQTKRKPSKAMMEEGLQAINKNKEEFYAIIMFGDMEDDRLFAENIGATYIDATLSTKEIINLIDARCS